MVRCCSQEETDSAQNRVHGIQALNRHGVRLGNCVLKYTVDFTTGNIIPDSGGPTTIASFFGQPGFTGPVDVAFLTKTQPMNDNDLTFNLNLDNRVSEP